MSIEKTNKNENLTEMNVVKEKTQSKLLNLKENVASSKEKKMPKTLKGMEDKIEASLPEVRGGLIEQSLKRIEELKKSIGFNGWKWAEGLLDNLGNDVVDLLDEKTVTLYIKHNLLVFGVFGGDATTKKMIVELWDQKETKEEWKNFIEKLCRIYAKYFERISKMFSKGLKDNFKDVPEPMKLHFIKNKDKIGELEKNLLRYIGSIDKIGQIYINQFDDRLNQKPNEEQYRMQMEALFADSPYPGSNIFSDLEAVFGLEQAIDDMIGVNLKTLEKSIKRTNKLENWDKERDILYYRFADKKMIGGWGSEVEIDNFDYDSLKLKGLDIKLSFQEGLRLANFKNWKNKKYGNKIVKFKRDLTNRKFDFYKTLVVDGTMLITREELQKRIPQCSDDKVVEKIATWLNN